MKRIAVLFSGQGSQYVGMGKRLHDSDEAVRRLFDQASDTLGMDMARLCFEGPADELNQTENTQPALLLCSVAAYRSWRAATGLKPAFMAGHSLGELSALVCAEVIGVEHGLRLARERGLAMSRCTTEQACSMVAVTKTDRRTVEEACRAIDGFGTDFVIANYNTATQFVLSGTVAGMDKAAAALKPTGAAVIALKVSGPFHSPFMSGAVHAFAATLARTEFHPAQVPVMSNVTALPHADSEQTKRALLEQISSPVLWSDTMAYLNAHGADVYLEAGPREVLKKLATANLPSAVAFALDEPADTPAWQRELAADIRTLKERPTVVGKCMAVAVCTKNNNWDDAQYQRGVVESYRELQSLQERLDPAGEASPEEMKKALHLLGRIFSTKGTPTDERQARYRQILEATGTAELLGADVAELAVQ